MKTKFLSLLAGASLVALAGVANAGQPMTLSNGQMDGVTAGAAATANAAALALGDFDAETFTQTATNSVTTIGSIGQWGVAVGQSLSTAAAASALFQAAVATHADSAATLP
jgi:hypothetical protein